MQFNDNEMRVMDLTSRIASDILRIEDRNLLPAAVLGSDGRIDLDKLVKGCYTALTKAHEPAVPVEPEAPKLVPAVPIRKSVNADYLVCLEDGKKFKSLKRHLRTHYNLSPEDYREKWNLPHDYPMVAPNYSATRSQLAKDNGLGVKK